jgi:hemoglobin
MCRVSLLTTEGIERLTTVFDTEVTPNDWRSEEPHMIHFTKGLRTARTWRIALSVILSGALAVSAIAQTANTRQTLYQRLGGYDGVASYIALVFPQVAQHPELTHMFRGHGKDSQQRQFQLVVDLICQKTGGPCAYIGRPMTAVHDGLGITEANWSTFMTIITNGMNEKKYPADVRDEFLAIWRSFHDEVVQK